MKIRKSRKLLIIIFLNILLTFIKPVPVSYYPEDFTTLERGGYSSGEVLLTSYYLYDPTDNAAQAAKFDYKNGIKINSFNKVKSLP